MIPYPFADVFGGRVFKTLYFVEQVMVELIYYWLYMLFDFAVVDEAALFGVYLADDDDVEAE